MSQTNLKVKLIAHTPDAEKVIASSARLCYSPVGVEEIQEGLTQEKIDKFLNHLIEIGHESPLEHCGFSFAVEGVSRITEIQLIRHRIASYSIQSGRYVNRKSPNFITPPRIKESELANKVFEDVCKASIEAYNNLFLILMLRQIGYTDDFIETLDIDKRIEIVANFNENDKDQYKVYEKKAIEDSRYAHLQSLETKIMLTMNIRSLINFFRHRCCFRSQWEIRQLAMQMLKECKRVCPTIFKNVGSPCVMSGICKEGNMQCEELKGKIPIK